MEKLILASGIVMTCIATVAFSSGYAKDKKEAVKMGVDSTGLTEAVDTEHQNNNDATAKYMRNNDTLPEKRTIADSGYNVNYDGDIDGKRIQLKEENGQIKELYIDGKKIPEGQYDQHKTLVDKIHRKIKEDKVMLKKDTELLKQRKEELQKQAEIMQKENAKMKKQSIIMQKDFKERQELLKQKQLEIEKHAELMNKNDSLMKKQALKMQQDLMKQMEQHKLKQVEFQKKIEKIQLRQQQLKEVIKDSLKIKRRTWKQPATYTKPVIPSKPSVPVKSTASVKPVTDVKPANTISTVSDVKAKPVISTKPAEIVTKTEIYSSSTSISDEIIHDLEDANIITTRNNLSFRFTNDELIVNGVKQPDALHQKFLKKYVTKPGETISISYSNHK
jgi:hypothetical protein